MDNQNHQTQTYTGHYNKIEDERFCMACKKTVRGRTDKKFCNEVCRNGFYNQRNAAVNNLVRNINNALSKNRRVLESFFTQENRVIMATSQQLLLKGFQFKYYTHQHTNKKGNTYYFCYDYGYLLLDGKYLLVRGREC